MNESELTMPDHMDFTDDGADPNQFEQELHREDPRRAGRRHVERMKRLLNEEMESKGEL